MFHIPSIGGFFHFPPTVQQSSVKDQCCTPVQSSSGCSLTLSGARTKNLRLGTPAARATDEEDPNSSTRRGTFTMDALHYFGIDFSWVRGPMYIFFDPDMDEDWRLLIQAAGLCVVLIAIYFLDKFGAFVHIKSRRATVPPLLVAVCAPEAAVDLRALALRRGVVDDKLTAEEEVNYVDLPRRGEEVELVCGTRTLAGIVLEAGTPRASEKVRKEWAQRMKDRSITVLLLTPGDSVIATLLEHRLEGRILKWRFPRFLQKAYKRRTNRQDEVKTYVTFFSSKRKRVMAVVPVSSGFAKEVLRGLPALESPKSK